MSLRGRRTIPAAEFFTGTWSTALDDDEILARVGFPVWTGRCGFAVEEVARRHGDFAIAGACVAVEVDGGGCVEPLRDRTVRHRIDTGASHRRRAVGASASRRATSMPRHLDDAAVDDLTSIPYDLNGSADYRRRIGATVVGPGMGQRHRGGTP